MLLFLLKESFRLFSKAKLSSLLTYISGTIAVVLVVVSFFLYQSSEKLEKYLKENINISIFLKDSVQKNRLEQLKSEIMQYGSVSSINYISKDEAVEIFVRETGEDFRNLLDYNPLPASFEIKLKSEFAEHDLVSKLINQLSSLDWVDEVVHKDDFVQKLLTYIDEFKVYVFGLAVVILFVSLYLVYSTVKLIINSRTEEFETMKLVGAKLTTIKGPVIFHGLLIGLFSAITAWGLFYLIITYAGRYISTIKLVQFDQTQLILVLLVSGPLLAIFVTVLSLRKVSLKIST